jgi:hypothetical protein
MIRKPRSSPLIAAVRSGDLAQIERLLKSGDDIEEADMHGFKGLPLRTACFAGDPAVVKALLDHGANPNALASDGPAAPLRAALRAGKHDIVRLLIEHGSDVPVGLELPLGIDLPAGQMLPPDDAFLPIYQADPLAKEAPKSPVKDDNALDFTPTFSTADVEEVDIKACRGVDTSILSIEFASSSADLTARPENTSAEKPAKS